MRVVDDDARVRRVHLVEPMILLATLVAFAVFVAVGLAFGPAIELVVIVAWNLAVALALWAM